MKLSCIGPMIALFCATPALAASAVQQAGPGSGAASVLSAIVHPPLRIINAPVLDANGAVLGAVQRVEVTPDGVPVAVAITPAGQPDRIEVLDADAVRYDPVANRIVARSKAHG